MPLRDVHTEAYWESSSQELQLGGSLGNGELCCQPVTTGLDRSHGNSGAGTALTRCPKLKPGHGDLDPHVDQPLDVSAPEKAYIRPSTSCLLRTAFTGDLSCGPLVASFPVPGCLDHGPEHAQQGADSGEHGGSYWNLSQVPNSELQSVPWLTVSYLESIGSDVQDRYRQGWTLVCILLWSGQS